MFLLSKFNILNFAYDNKLKHVYSMILYFREKNFAGVYKFIIEGMYLSVKQIINRK